MSAWVSTGLIRDDNLPQRRREEEQLGVAVARFLRAALPPDADFTHIPLGGLRTKKAGAKLAAQGANAGYPDYLIVYGGRALFIEIKAPTGTLSPVQRQKINKLHFCGADVAVCRSVPEVEHALLEAGVRLRARIAA